MRKKRLTKYVIVTIIMVIAFILYKFYIPNARKSLVLLPHSPIILGEGEKLHFFNGGFAISGSYGTRFYDPDGTSISLPLSYNASLDEKWIINMSTQGYMLVNGKSIYKTSDTPFQKVYDFDVPTGTGIREFSDYLVVLFKDESNILIPKLYDLNKNVLLNQKDMDSLYYLDSSYNTKTNSLSLLALSLESSFPSSKVLNYIDGTTLYSVISITNDTYYRILQLPSHVILVATHEIVCYNVDGTLQWSIKNNDIKDHKVVEYKDGFIFYFSYPIDNNGDGIFFNALVINSDGSFTMKDFPRDIVDFQPFGKNFIGLRYGRNIVILDGNGSINQEYYVSEDIVSLYYNKYHKNNLYLLDRDNQLHIYSTIKEDSHE